jgi:hypothetical protein
MQSNRDPVDISFDQLEKVDLDLLVVPYVAGFPLPEDIDIQISCIQIDSTIVLMLMIVKIH